MGTYCKEKATKLKKFNRWTNDHLQTLLTNTIERDENKFKARVEAIRADDAILFSYILKFKIKEIIYKRKNSLKIAR